MSKFKTEHLKQGERAVLFCVYNSAGGQMKANEIASGLNVAAPTVTPILSRLEEKGYILRTMDKTDRRAVIVTLSEPGCAVIEASMKQMEAHFEQMVGHLGEEDAQTLLRIIGKTLSYYKKDN